MIFDKEKFGINSLNFANLKFKITQKGIQPKSYREIKKDSAKSLVASFHQNLYHPKVSNSKFKTSKNSPDRKFKEKPKLITPHTKKETKIKAKISLNQNDKFNIENLLEKKILKIQQKEKKYQGMNIHSKTNTTIGFSINNSSVQSNFSYLQNHNNQAKKKVVVQQQNKIIDSSNKRSSSALVDEGYFHNKNKSSASKIVSASSTPPKNQKDIKNIIKETANTSNKNYLIFSHIKHQKILPSSFMNKPTLKFKIEPKICSKTSFPTKENSRKNSPFQSNENLLEKREKEAKNETKIDPKIVLKNYEKYADKYAENKKLPNYEAIYSNAKMKNPNTFLVPSNNHIDSERNSSKKPLAKQAKKTGIVNAINSSSIGNVNNASSNVSGNAIGNSNNEPNTSKKIENNEKYFDEILNKVMKKKQYIEKDKITTKEKEKDKEKLVNKDKLSAFLKDKKNEEKITKKESSPDRDIDNEENKNDSFLQYINSNIESKNDILTNSTSNINNSFDSHYSIQSEAAKCYALSKEVDLITSYIRRYYQKYRQYPKTKIHFYKYGRLLGKGAFGKVNLSLQVLTGRLVAIKSINKKKIKSDRQRAKIQLETSIMKKLSKSNYVVKILENYETQKHICIVMEYICAGDLLTYIKKRSKLTEQLAKYIFKQIMVGLYHIHANHIVHLDIKLDNILIDLDNKVKICDFGVSKKIKKGDVMNEQCGTPAYMAPEIIKGNGYEGYAADLWSCGVVLYAMLSGTIPFKGNDINDLNSLIIKGKYKEIEGISREAAHLIRCLLETDPKKRITDEAVLNHPWLAGVDISSKNDMNLFTNSERILLAQSNVDYRDINNKENMVENFSLKNLDSTDDQNQKNVQTKSAILAPYNSSYDESYLNDEFSVIYSICDQDNEELKIKNSVIKFVGKTKELNRNYELNNNGEIDNGIIISLNDSGNGNGNGNDYKNNKSPFALSNHFSPVSALSPYELNTGKKIKDNYLSEFSRKIDEEVVNKVAQLGYKRSYVMKCLKENEFNYATAIYCLFDKFK